jgi:hypothetical protein
MNNAQTLLLQVTNPTNAYAVFSGYDNIPIVLESESSDGIPMFYDDECFSFEILYTSLNGDSYWIPYKDGAGRLQVLNKDKYRLIIKDSTKEYRFSKTLTMKRVGLVADKDTIRVAKYQNTIPVTWEYTTYPDNPKIHIESKEDVDNNNISPDDSSGI